MFNLLKDKKGEAYISAVIYLMIATAVLVVVLQVISVVSARLSLDDDTKQLVKQIQLAGGVDDDVIASFNTIKELRGRLTGIEIVADGTVYDYFNGDDRLKLPLSTHFTLTLHQTHFVGFTPAHLHVPITISTAQIGLTEKYFKDLEGTP